MNILMLTPYLPYPLHSGGQIRTYNLLRKLSKDHSITLFALIKDEDEQQSLKYLKPYCADIQLFKRSQKPFTLRNILRTGLSSYPFLVMRNYVPQMTIAIERELSAKHYDLIHAETFYMMPHLPATDVPTLLVEQTIEYLGYESYAQKSAPLLRPLLQIDIQKIRTWERHFWNSCTQLVVMSEDDKQFVRAEVTRDKPIHVVENGVDVEWFSQIKRDEPTEPTVLSVGTFRWLPNVEAVRYLVTKVWPLVKEKLPTAKLHIVGAAPTSEVEGYAQRDSSITVSGNIPDIRTAFAQAHVLAASVWSGKGTRYKVLEALAAGTPVVATSTAVEGLGITPGKEALVTSNEHEFADALVTALESNSIRESLRKQGRLFVSRRFDWTKIASKLDAVYREIGEGKNRG